MQLSPHLSIPRSMDKGEDSDEDLVATAAAAASGRRCNLPQSLLLLFGLAICVVLGWQATSPQSDTPAHAASVGHLRSQINAQSHADVCAACAAATPAPAVDAVPIAAAAPIAASTPAPPAAVAPPVVIQTLVAFTQFDTSHFSYGLNTLSAIAEWMVVEPGQPLFNVTIIYYCTAISDIRPWLDFLPPQIRDRFRIFVFPTEVGFNLPLEHRAEFVRQRNNFDMFMYMENDVLIRRHHMLSWYRHHLILAAANPTPPAPNEQLTIGFLRFELIDDAAKRGEATMPDFNNLGTHAKYSIGGHDFVHAEYSYAATHMLTAAQLQVMLAAHEVEYLKPIGPAAPGHYDFRREVGAYGPEFLGVYKLLPADSIQALQGHLIHHQPNNYPQKTTTRRQFWDNVRGLTATVLASRSSSTNEASACTDVRCAFRSVSYNSTYH